MPELDRMADAGWTLLFVAGLWLMAQAPDIFLADLRDVWRRLTGRKRDD